MGKQEAEQVLMAWYVPALVIDRKESEVGRLEEPGQRGVLNVEC
jgi:hypothetical protein